MGQHGFEDAACQRQAAFEWDVGIGYAGHVERLASEFAGLLARKFDSVDLGRDPLAPVLDGAAILRQKGSVAVTASEGATEIGVARPLKAATSDKAGGRA